MDLIENQDQKLNEVYLMYADQVCKIKSLNNNQCMVLIHEFFKFYFEDVKRLLNERNKMIEKHKKIKQKSEIEEDDRCNICFEKNKKIRWLIFCKCGKSFHDKCLQTWWNENNSCPFCRQLHIKSKTQFKIGWDHRYFPYNLEVKSEDHGDDFIDD